MVTINIGRKEMVFFSVVVLVFAVAGVAVSLNSGNYLVHGHTSDELFNVSGGGSGVVETGVLNHGGIIPIPSGYVESDCKWIVSLENIQAVGTVNSDDTLGVWVGSDRKVHVGDWDASANYKTVEPGDTSGDVNYMIICGTPAVSSGGFTPSSYNGEESVTFPNGLIFKSGYIARSGDTTTITFDTTFPGGVVSVSVNENVWDGNDNMYYITSFTKTNLSIKELHPITGFYWQAWGY